MESLRKVNFYLEKDPGLGLLDEGTEEEQKELQENIKLRHGAFHVWGNEIITIENENYQNTYAIVEELETGKVFQVAPKNIQFINS